MPKDQITIADLYKGGGVSKNSVYKAIRAKKLTFEDGKASITKLLTEWNSKRDLARSDRIGPALVAIATARGISVTSREKPKRGAQTDAPAVDADGIPMHLSPKMRDFWKTIIAEYVLESDALLILQVACESWDAAEVARALLDKDGMILNSRRHPAFTMQTTAYSTFLKAMRQLGIDEEPSAPVGRPKRSGY
jgi:phage terminase small subunit